MCFLSFDRWLAWFASDGHNRSTTGHNSDVTMWLAVPCAVRPPHNRGFLQLFSIPYFYPLSEYREIASSVSLPVRYMVVSGARFVHIKAYKYFELFCVSVWLAWLSTNSKNKGSATFFIRVEVHHLTGQNKDFLFI